MKICPSCAAFLPCPARRLCRTPEVHSWYTPAERDALPLHVRDVVMSALVRRGLLTVRLPPVDAMFEADPA